MFFLHEPSPQDVGKFVTASRDLPLSYGAVGLAKEPRAGFAVDEQIAVIGNGAAAFERAASALAAWKHFDLSWVSVRPPGLPIDPGTVVAVVVRHLGLWSMNGCRVVYSVGARSGQEFGFAYGTLTNHAEAGEEIFKVSLDPNSGDVTYSIRAVSRPQALLARLGYPVTRSLQARFRRESARAMIQALSG
jgi:uncharacterized protein (UPF0548 family)